MLLRDGWPALGKSTNVGCAANERTVIDEAVNGFTGDGTGTAATRTLAMGVTIIDVGRIHVTMRRMVWYNEIYTFTITNKVKFRYDPTQTNINDNDFPSCVMIVSWGNNQIMAY